MGYLSKLLRYVKTSQSKQQNQQNQAGSQQNGQPAPPKKLLPQLNANLEEVRKLLGPSFDVGIRTFSLGQNRVKGVSCAVLFLKGMTDGDAIQEHIIRPLQHAALKTDETPDAQQTMLQTIQWDIIPIGEVQQASTFEEVTTAYLSGDTVLLIDGIQQALVIGTRKWEFRSVTTPQTETVNRGSHEGFTEDLLTNTSLLRRRIKNKDLTMETLILGQRTQTTVCIVYLNGVINPLLVEEIRRRLRLIQTDAILESGYIEQFIEDAPTSIFSTIGNSEKPDNVASSLLEGRAAILVDGTPMVLTVPHLFLSSFQSSEDYYSRPYFASLVRTIRFLGYATSVFVPAIYVLLLTFHQELIPTPLLFSIAAAEEGVPFPTFLAVLIMGLIFEIVMEAGVRLPRPIGQAISIVGTLVIGESAVRAGLIADPVIIVVGLTALSSFVVPSQRDSATLLRLYFLFFSGTFGAFGFLVAFISIYLHLCSLRTFGVPYLSPFAPLTLRDLKDTFIRLPIWTMGKRPRLLGTVDPQRQDFRLDPTKLLNQSTAQKSSNQNKSQKASDQNTKQGNNQQNNS